MSRYGDFDLDFLTMESTTEKVTAEEVHHEAFSADHSPSQAQISAGNYRHGHVLVHGLDISIETARGSRRSGVDPSGKPWSVVLPNHYGYVKRTEGADGEHVDCYIGPHLDSKEIYVIDQVHADSQDFDEHKAFIGFLSEDQAIAAYNRAFSDHRGPDRMGAITTMSIQEFKDWLKHGDTTEPLASKSVTMNTGLTHYDQGAITEDDITSPSDNMMGFDSRRAEVGKVYNSVSELPKAVKDKIKSPKKRRQWMAVWNSTYASTKDESRAFAAAWSVAQKGVDEHDHRPFGGKTIEKYDEDQPRDEKGQWTSGGGGSESAQQQAINQAKSLGYSFVGRSSPDAEGQKAELWQNKETGTSVIINENGSGVFYKPGSTGSEFHSKEEMVNAHDDAVHGPFYGSSHEALTSAGYKHEGMGQYSNEQTGTKAQIVQGGHGQGAVWKPGVYSSTHQFDNPSQVIAAHEKASAGEKGFAGKPPPKEETQGKPITGVSEAMAEYQTGPGLKHEWEAKYYTDTKQGQRTLEVVRAATPLSKDEANQIFASARGKLDQLDPHVVSKIASTVAAHKMSTKNANAGKNLDEAFSRVGVTAERDFVVWRGLNIYGSAASKFEKALSAAQEHSQGAIYIKQFEGRYVPSTPNYRVASQFGSTHLLRITVQKGTTVLPSRDLGGGFQNEHEITLIRGATLRIVGAAKDEKGRTVISTVLSRSKPHVERHKFEKAMDEGTQDRTEHFSSDFTIEVEGGEAYDSDTGRWSDDIGKASKKYRRLNPVRLDRPENVEATNRYRRIFVDAFNSIKPSIERQIRHAVDSKRKKASVIFSELQEHIKKQDEDLDWDLAAQIAEGLDLSSLDVVTTDSADVGASVFGDTGRLALGSVGVPESRESVYAIDERAVAWAKDHVGELISQITDSTRNMVRRTIYDGLLNGKSAAEIASDVGDAYPFSEERASLIASTEIARAHSQGALEGYKQAQDAGVRVLKEWLPGEDPCEEICQPNVEQGPIPLDEDFESGDDAPPGHPRCICALTAVVEDEQTDVGEEGSTEDFGLVAKKDTDVPTIFVCRHGSTEFNQGGVGKDRIRGHLDVPLDDQGVKEAHELAAKLADEPISHIYASDLSRTVDTAKIIAADHPGVVIRTSKALRSWNLGDMQGKKVSGKIVEDIEYFVHNPGKIPPGGDSFSDFMHTFLNAIADLELRASEERCMCIVTHARNVQLMEIWIDSDRDINDIIDHYAEELAEEPDSVKPGGFIRLEFHDDEWELTERFKDSDSRTHPIS